MELDLALFSNRIQFYSQVFLVTSKVEQGYNENGNGRDARTQGNTCYNGMYLARANRRVIQVK